MLEFDLLDRIEGSVNLKTRLWDESIKSVARATVVDGVSPADAKKRLDLLISKRGDVVHRSISAGGKAAPHPVGFAEILAADIDAVPLGRQCYYLLSAPTICGCQVVYFPKFWVFCQLHPKKPT